MMEEPLKVHPFSQSYIVRFQGLRFGSVFKEDLWVQSLVFGGLEVQGLVYSGSTQHCTVWCSYLQACMSNRQKTG